MLSAKDHMREVDREVAIVNLTVENGSEQGGEGFCPQETWKFSVRLGLLAWWGPISSRSCSNGPGAVGSGNFHPINSALSFTKDTRDRYRMMRWLGIIGE